MAKSDIQRMKQSQAAKRTNLADWWASQEQELDLPSGLHVVVRDVDLEDLIVSGNIPNTLLAVFPELQGMGDEEAGKKLMEEHPQSFADLLDLIAKGCLVEPRVGDVTDPENGTIALVNLRGKDKMFLFTWVNRETRAVRSFREDEVEPDPAT